MTATATAPTRYVGHVMGMPISLALRGRHTDDTVARDAWHDVMADLHDVDLVFSTYRPESVVSRINRGEIAVADGPAELAEVMALAATAERESAGAFSVWLPGPDGRTRLDPSGVVKGWAAERAAGVLRALPDTDFCLSAGGDIACRTLDEAGEPWRIGVENPAARGTIVAVVPILTGAVATSGTAHRGSHILDARTGRTPVGLASVTVLARSLVDADIDATAAYAHGADAVRWLANRADRVGLVVRTDGTTTVTRGAVAPPMARCTAAPAPTPTAATGAGPTG